jgi:hypothetical protein
MMLPELRERTEKTVTVETRPLEEAETAFQNISKG